MIYFMYSRATKGGGALVKTTKSGGGTTATSSAGGGTTATSSSGGGVSTSTANGGGSSQTSSAGGGTQTSTSTRTFVQLNLVSGSPENDIGGPNYGYHKHEVQIPGERFNHSHDVSVPSHTHTVSIPTHSHNFNVPNHSHDVSIPNHTHNVSIPNHSHEIELPDHNHDIEHGIYKLDRLPTSVEIKVDGSIVPYTATSGTGIDIVPYLGTDSSGKVTRGWHEIEIKPNDLCRINAQITTQFFIQSRGGGNF
ncbi:hypothetical protein MHI57_10710 [Cytobacillus sp. FSL K6-0129]|uniref:hypothetical protein n=1 Tax=Cytobacillus sp. FSL K6-0129 TaxID=2921421 RepID=UPI0030F63203